MVRSPQDTFEICDSSVPLYFHFIVRNLKIFAARGYFGAQSDRSMQLKRKKSRYRFHGEITQKELAKSGNAGELWQTEWK